MSHVATLAGILLALCWSAESRALLTSQVSFTEGYWEGINRNHQLATLIDWRINHMTSSGIETTIDLGLNNDINQGSWQVYPYQAYVSVPLQGASQLGTFYRSRAQLGRQLLTEGFELAILDGLQLPYYWSDTGGVWAFAGVDHVLEDNTLTTYSQLYGASLFQELAGFHTRAGVVEKHRDDIGSQNLVHAQVLRNFENAPLSPTIFLKGQVDTADTSRFNQVITELSLLPLDATTLTLGYNQRDVNRLYAGDAEVIYRLFAISPSKSEDASLSWTPSWDFGVATRFKRITYLSQGGPETAYQVSVYSTHRFKRSSLSPGVSAIDSYGLWSYDFGGKYRWGINDLLGLLAELDIAKINKVNGINGWAYHERSGIDFNPLPQLLARALLELESNSIFSFDARLAFYVSYFFF